MLAVIARLLKGSALKPSESLGGIKCDICLGLLYCLCMLINSESLGYLRGFVKLSQFFIVYQSFVH